MIEEQDQQPSSGAAKAPPSLLDTYLELDALIEKPPTLKLLGDNLRNYPLLVACAAGVGLLWPSDYRGAKVAAILWSCWLLWFALLTVAQSAFLVAAVMVHVLRRHDWFRREFRRPGENWVTLLLAGLAVIFLGSSIMVTVALIGALKR